MPVPPKLHITEVQLAGSSVVDDSEGDFMANISILDSPSTKEERKRPILEPQKSVKDIIPKNFLLRAFYDLIGEKLPRQDDEYDGSNDLLSRTIAEVPNGGERHDGVEEKEVDFTGVDPYYSAPKDSENDTGNKLKTNLPLDQNPEYLRGLIRNRNNDENDDNDDAVLFWGYAYDSLCDFVIIAKGENDPKWDLLRSRLTELKDETKSSGSDKLKDAVEMDQGGEYHSIPLHLALRRKPPLDIIQSLVSASPRVLAWSDRNDVHRGWLPLHCACEYRASSEVIQYLVKTYPGAREVQTYVLRHTPLDLACNFRQVHVEDAPKADTIRCLSESCGVERAVHMQNKKGNTPFDTFLRTLGFLRMRNKALDREECIECMNILVSSTLDQNKNESRLRQIGRRKYKEKVVGSTNTESSRRTGEYVKSLHMAPSWISDPILAHPSVQSYLNDEMVNTIPTVVLMADLYAHVFLIVAFTITSNAAIPHRYDKPGDMHSQAGWNIFLFVPVVYLFLREANRVCLEGIFVSLANPWRVLNVLHSFLAFASSLIMILPGLCGEEANNSVRTLVMVTSGFVWVMGLVFLKCTYRPFSVFVSGVFCIMIALVPFLISTFLILGAFAGMYYINTESTLSCQENFGLEPSAFCTYSSSFLQVYTIFINGMGDYFFTNAGVQDIPGVKEEYLNEGVLALSIIYGFLVAILLRTMVIAIANDAWTAVQDRGVPVFWMHRLIFLAGVESIRSIQKVRSCCEKLRKHTFDDPSPSVDNQGNEIGNDQWEIFWHIVALTYADHRDGSILWKEMETFQQYRYSFLICGFTDDGDWKKIEASLWFRRVFFSVFIFFWTLSGFATFGWSWPKEARRALFCPHINTEKKNAQKVGHAHNQSVSKTRSVTEDQKQVDLIKSIIQVEFESMKTELISELTKMKQDLARN